MCHQITYTLPCEHVRTQIIYCADAVPIATASSSSTHSSSSSGGSKSKSSSSSSPKHGNSSSSSRTSKHDSSSSSKTSSSKHHHHQRQQQQQHQSQQSQQQPQQQRIPCKNLTQQSLPYPTPPSFTNNPASSPLLPKCPLEEACPFEQKNRCWNCCWCGKSWNERGRCACIMIIDGSQVQCDHICCGTCEAAWGAAA